MLLRYLLYIRAEIEGLRAHLGVTDENRTPLGGESLRQFYRWAMRKEERRGGEGMREGGGGGEEKIPLSPSYPSSILLVLIPSLPPLHLLTISSLPYYYFSTTTPNSLPSLRLYLFSSSSLPCLPLILIPSYPIPFFYLHLHQSYCIVLVIWGHTIMERRRGNRTSVYICYLVYSSALFFVMSCYIILRYVILYHMI